MRNDMEVKGRLKWYLRWPIILNIIVGIMTLGVVLIDHKAGGLMGVFFLVHLIFSIVVSFYSKPAIMEELINFGLQYGQIQKKLLHELEIPYGVLDSSGKMMWENDALTKLVGNVTVHRNIQSIFPSVNLKKILEMEEKCCVEITHEERIYRAEFCRMHVEDFSEHNDMVVFDHPENVLIAMFMFDETDIRRYIRENQEQKLVAGIIFIDNFEEAMSSTEEVRRSLLAALIERKITKYMQSYDAIITKVEKDRYTFVINHKHMSAIQSSRFSILDEVREINIGNEMSVTLCIGVGMNAISYGQSYTWAQNAIDLALGRGGDQAVVKAGDKISYYGGKTKQVEKGTRVKARVKAHALKQIIMGKDQVVIMGHKIGDVDSFGSAIGVYRAAKTLNKPAHIVINEVTTSVRPIINNFKNNPDYEPDMFLKSSEAASIINMETALIVVDVNRPSYTEGPELLNRTKTVVILDHHRQSSESIESPVLSYIEPYASSACEMVAEILQYIADGVKLRPIEADAMFAGLMIDTNNFSSKTGVRTFEAAAFLKKSGADITRVHLAFRDSMEIYRARAEAVRHASMDNGMAYAVCPAEGLESPTIVGAQVANELLNITGIRASFVFTRVKDTIYVSARSTEGTDGLNVQLVMERIGGGGHGTIAGAQIQNMSENQAMALVKRTILNMQREGAI
ncbi:MAG: DHH family phosphoesterase [Frisingicoccus sp.]|uniref:DHH family phosphoesterase n=1 Tax=Frisingicoccus sp. TaxID=1918627 RepID=UPI0025BB7B39|nr:DHH family phosphoesterase [Frisingicoccus sp.]MDD6232742.1 DHH family phosphoesterase [Frisingicoccus sp.]MDY4834417.1 DHH family phosphoesterase [Frisingicoccus sp.]